MIHRTRSPATTFASMWRGLRTFAMQTDDPTYQKGDTLIVSEADGEILTGRKLILQIINAAPGRIEVYREFCWLGSLVEVEV